MTIKTKRTSAMQLLESFAGQLTLGSLLRAIRLGEEVSQIDFAKKLRVSSSHLCDLEKGRKMVSVKRAALFARLLGYSREQFVRLAVQDMVREARLDLVVEIKAA